MFTHCLICTDFTDGLQRLVDFVPSLAKSGLTHIVFSHSVPLWEEGGVPRIDEQKMAAAQAQLSGAIRQIPEGVDVKVEVLSGRPQDTIPPRLDVDNIDVILVGASIHNSLQQRLFGSTSQALAKATGLPLLFLRPQLISTYTCEELALRCEHLWRYLLIPYNDSASAHYLIEQIKACVQRRPQSTFRQCMLFWVVDDGGRSELMPFKLKEAETKLVRLQQELEQWGLQVNIAVRQGNPLQALLTAAMDYDISAIAIASSHRNPLLDWTVPSFAKDVVHRSWFPVMLFTPKNIRVAWRAS